MNPKKTNRDYLYSSRLTTPDMVSGLVAWYRPEYGLSGVRANTITYSEDFSNASWSKVSSITVVPVSNIQNPFGVNTGYYMSGSATTAAKNINHSNTTVNATSYIYSVYLKSGTSQFAQLYIGVPSTVGINIDLSNGVVTNPFGTANLTYGSTAVGNGWYRAYFSFTAGTSSSTYIGIVSSATSARAEISSANNNKYIYVWGAQLEQFGNPAITNVDQFVPTPYIANTSVANSVTGAPIFGQGISYWANSATSNLTLVPNALINLPVYSSPWGDLRIGLPSLLFNGTNSYLQIANPAIMTGTRSNNVFIMLKDLQPTATTYSFSVTTNVSATNPRFAISTCQTAGAVAQILNRKADSDSTNTFSTLYSIGDVNTSTFYRLVSAEINYSGTTTGTQNITQNGFLETQTKTNLSSAIATTTPAFMYIGRGSAGGYFKGNIYEIIIYSTDSGIGPVNRRLIENYLYKKYKLKNFAPLYSS